jgi:O-antigen/teichoic acid export membrane protein
MINLIQIGQTILNLVLTAGLLIVLQLNLLGVVIASFLSSAAGVISLTIILYQQFGKFHFRWNANVMRHTLSFGLKGYTGNLLQFFNYRLDVFLVNYYLGPVDVGIYSVSVRLAELLWQVPNAVSFVILPKAAATHETVMNKFTPRVLAITLAITILGALGLAIIGIPLIRLIYSSAFDQAYGPLLYLLPGVVLLGGSKVLTNEIAGRGYPHYNAINAGLALLLTISLDILLVPSFGPTGAAIASSLAYSFIFVLSVGFFLFVRSKKKLAQVVLTQEN